MPLQSHAERDRLIGDFWESVRSTLIKVHDKSAREADRGIGQYRHVLHRHEIGDLVYNQGVEKTAAVVNSIIEKGLPEEA